MAGHRNELRPASQTYIWTGRRVLLWQPSLPVFLDGLIVELRASDDKLLAPVQEATACIDFFGGTASVDRLRMSRLDDHWRTHRFAGAYSGP